MSAQNATDLQSFVDRLNAVYTRLKDCPTSGVTCANTPAVVSYQFDQNTPHMFLSHSKLLSLNSALTSLLSDTAIQRGFRTAEDCVGCDSSTGYSVPELCAILDGLGLSEMKQPHNHAFNNDAWLTYAEALLTGIENLFDSGSDCPNFVCAPSTCPCGEWPPASSSGAWPCGGLIEEYVVSNGTTSYYDGAVCYATAQGEPLSVITELRLVGDVTCKATANSCEWQGPASSVERRDIMYDFSGNPSVFADWYPIAAAKINLVNCAWVAGAAGASKETGQTPVGEYLGADVGALCTGGCIVRGRLIVTEAT